MTTARSTTETETETETTTSTSVTDVDSGSDSGTPRADEKDDPNGGIIIISRGGP